MPAAARRHLHDLARQHDVSLHWVDTWEKCEAFALIREVRVPWIRDGQDYLIALHELGHCIAPGAARLEEAGTAEPFTTLALEGLAWAWVAQVADRDLLEPGDWDVVLLALESHYDKAVGFPHDPAGGTVSQSDQPLATDLTTE